MFFFFFLCLKTFRDKLLQFPVLTSYVQKHAWFFTLQIQIFYISISIAYYHINYTNSGSTETSE